VREDLHERVLNGLVRIVRIAQVLVGDAEGAALVRCDPKELVWTSGATESINLALKGAAEFHKAKGRHLITVRTEHKATLDSMRELERRGFEVTYLEVGADGLLDLDALAALSTLISGLIAEAKAAGFELPIVSGGSWRSPSSRITASPVAICMPLVKALCEPKLRE